MSMEPEILTIKQLIQETLEEPTHEPLTVIKPLKDPKKVLAGKGGVAASRVKHEQLLTEL